MTEREETLHACNYIGAFIDVLGQRKSLCSFSFLPDLRDAQQRAKLLAVLSETVGAVRQLHDDVASDFNAYRREFMQRAIPPDKRGLYETLCKTAIHFQAFSDGIVVFLPLDEAVARCPAVSIMGLLVVCGTMCLRGLACRAPIRGGIDLGWGVESPDIGLYGSIIPKAYALESKVAQWPRIVVGDDVVTYLLRLKEAEADDICTQYDRTLAPFCMDLLSTDRDGVWFVDYLGEGFKKHCSGPNPREIATASQFISDQLARWQELRNTKLTMRYAMLRDYFASRNAPGDPGSHPTGEVPRE